MNIVRVRSRFTCVLAMFISVAALLCFGFEAQALPAFSRQTGMECAACHVGGLGPQLTAAGRKFKLLGYTDSNSSVWTPPVSAMAIGSFTATGAGVPGGAGPHDKPNSNLALDETSLFLAGKLYGGLGAFVQTTWEEPDHHFGLDQFELRYASTLGNSDDIVGVSINNNPTMQDVWNTLPVWGFPYTASALAPSPAASPLLAGGLEHQVLGTSVYAYLGKYLYAEVGNYFSLSHGLEHNLGIDDEAGKLRGLSPYLRLAYSRDVGHQSLEFGAFGMRGKLDPDRSGGLTNKNTDLGLDASYQYFADKRNVFSLNTNYIYEKQNRAQAFAAGDAADKSGHLNSWKLDLSYYYDKSYGLTAGVFDTWGSKDVLLYAPGAVDGSRTGSPNSRGAVLQADWTPFGKEESWGAPWANLRLGLQYTLYDKFNGASSNYDGFGRKASDNNTLFLFAWTAF